MDAQVVTNSIAANNPHWLAPEILQGMKFSRASDVYPFGTILWELMTWKFPYETDGGPRNPAAVLFGTVFKNERPAIPPNNELLGGPCPVYTDYCKLIKQCWKGTPEKRPTFKDIVPILENFLYRLGSTDVPKFMSAPVPVKPPVYVGFSSYQSIFIKGAFTVAWCSSVFQFCEGQAIDVQEGITHYTIQPTGNRGLYDAPSPVPDVTC